MFELAGMGVAELNNLFSTVLRDGISGNHASFAWHRITSAETDSTGNDNG